MYRRRLHGAPLSKKRTGATLPPIVEQIVMVAITEAFALAAGQRELSRGRIGHIDDQSQGRNRTDGHERVGTDRARLKDRVGVAAEGERANIEEPRGRRFVVETVPQGELVTSPPRPTACVAA